MGTCGDFKTTEDSAKNLVKTRCVARRPVFETARLHRTLHYCKRRPAKTMKAYKRLLEACIDCSRPANTAVATAGGF